MLKKQDSCRKRSKSLPPVVSANWGVKRVGMTGKMGCPGGAAEGSAKGSPGKKTKKEQRIRGGRGKEQQKQENRGGGGAAQVTLHPQHHTFKSHIEVTEVFINLGDGNCRRRDWEHCKAASIGEGKTAEVGSQSKKAEAR